MVDYTQLNYAQDMAHQEFLDDILIQFDQKWEKIIQRFEWSCSHAPVTFG